MPGATNGESKPESGSGSRSESNSGSGSETRTVKDVLALHNISCFDTERLIESLKPNSADAVNKFETACKMAKFYLLNILGAQSERKYYLISGKEEFNPGMEKLFRKVTRGVSTSVFMGSYYRAIREQYWSFGFDSQSYLSPMIPTPTQHMQYVQDEYWSCHMYVFPNFAFMMTRKYPYARPSNTILYCKRQVRVTPQLMDNISKVAPPTFSFMFRDPIKNREDAPYHEHLRDNDALPIHEMMGKTESLRI